MRGKMDQTQIKKKLIWVLSNFISRSIEEARKVPYLMDRDNLVDILVRNPDIYRQMLLNGQIDEDGISRGKVVVKVDILDQIAEFKALDEYDLTFTSMVGQDALRPLVFEKINLLSKMFMAYFSNLIAIFEKTYEEFHERFRETMKPPAHATSLVSISWDDLEDIKKRAIELVKEGKFIQAFSIGRLMDPELISSDLVLFPRAGDSFARLLLQSLPWDVDLCQRMTKFILRTCYISHNHWYDIFHALMQLANQEPNRFHRELIIQEIEQDSIFCCNLLHETYENILTWKTGELRVAIEIALRI